MTLRAFRDDQAGVYKVEIPDGENVPSWAAEMTEMTEIEIADEFPPPPEQAPAETEPVRIACALRVPVDAGEVQTISGSYRVAAMMLMDVGVFLAIFNRNLGEDAPFIIPTNGIHASITEWGEDYAMIEIRDHAGGSLTTPSSFGFSLYSI